MRPPFESSSLEVLNRAADAVAERLAAVRDWGFSGRREGQYDIDIDVDTAAVTVLLDAGFAVLSEESGHSGDGSRLVVVDPLDGSTNASRGIPWFATSLCVVDDRGPAEALVVNQATGVRFEAVRDHGARVGDRQLRASSCAVLGEAVVGISGRPTREWGWWQFRALGAAALDLAAVAGGSLDGWVDMGTDAHGAWDYLAGVLLCTEGGAVVADALGRDLAALDHADRRTPVVAATPALLEALLTARRDA